MNIHRSFEPFRTSMSPDKLVNTIIWNKCKRVLRAYLRENELTEISVNRLSELTGIPKHLALVMLKEMNLEYFQRQGKTRGAGEG